MNDLRTIVAEVIAQRVVVSVGTPLAEVRADAVLARLEPLLRAAHWAVDQSPGIGGVWKVTSIPTDLLDALNTWMAER